MLMLQQFPSKPGSLISSSPWFSANLGINTQFPLAYSKTHRSTFLRSRKTRGFNLKHVPCARIRDHIHISDEKVLKGFEELGDYPFYDDEEKINQEKESDSGLGKSTEMQVLPSKFEFLDPEWLGIRPDPPSWPERDEVSRITIEQKANSLEIPISLRIIKKKLRWKEGFVDAGEYAYCSVKKAFSSLVFIIRELQDHTWTIKENYLYCEDLRAILNRMQGDMNLMFVWLFQQVFSKTPTLMVYTMILLANFSVHSMTIQQPRSYTQKAIAATMSLVEEEIEEFGRDSELGLWKASRTEGGVIYKVLDDQMKQQIVYPESPDVNNVEIFRTSLMYQMCVDKEPDNLLLLINYARFLYLVAKDYDRAEELFRRAIQVEPPDAEAFGQYAYFLWLVRNDHWQAEEKYLQALDVDPNNAYHASNYAYFLWTTGAKDTCFPLNYDKVS
ncbi:Tetratricopeptide-like helical [Corchorus olitorius]|uniref:Tetratricopeptide-like helical n=1 Tax=Corchorus olitorius TaxID=93759 RepID=A0A1R3I0X4_9ROSI|nr:Tetratricopeptide-like helical [Corchorus olitorius]